MFRIPLMRPFINQRVKERVAAVLESGFLTEGPVVRELEDAFRAFTGSRHAIAVTSCTTGLELALRTVGIGPGDEVIVPDFTYPATAHAVRLAGASAVIVDVDPRTFLIDYDAIEAAITPRTRALMPVSEFGNPLDHDVLAAIKRRHALLIIEDAACAIGSTFRGVPTGNHADITVFSLHPRKFITTGEGGIITTNHDGWAAWMDEYKHFGIHGKDATGKPVFRSLGTNLKLSDLCAAVGAAQMESVHELLRQRQVIARTYFDLLQGRRGIALPTITAGGEHSWQSFTVRVADRDATLNRLRSAGIEAQFGAFALHLQPAFRPGATCRWHGSLAGSRQAFDEGLALPLPHDLADTDQRDVVDALSAVVQHAA